MTYINSLRDPLQSFTSFREGWYHGGDFHGDCGEYLWSQFRFAPRSRGAFRSGRNEVSDSTEQISAVRRGFDNAVTYATLCKISRGRSRDFVPVTINFFDSALDIGSTDNVTRRDATRPGVGGGAGGGGERGDT